MRRTAMLGLAVAVGLGVVGGSGSASAECAMPAPAMAPDGMVLPPNPVLYRFELAYHRNAPPFRIEGAKGPVPFTVKDVSATDSIRVLEIRVAATSGTFTVRGDDWEVPRTYSIGAAGAAHVAPVVEGVRWVEDAWSCSHSLGLVIEARGQGVVAFRAEWTGGQEALLPPNDRYFWHPEMMGGEIDPAALSAFLGHPNCVANLIPDSLIGRKDFRLFAKYADGSELEVELPRASGVQPPPQAQPQPQPQPQPQAQPQPRPAFASRPRVGLEPWKVALATAVSIAALISVSTLLVARRRRRNGTMVP